ncbi:MAG: hypothetical protein IPN17_06375 [Deltaproteobacteria bacterium]|nr:hypothetical protein [Deltaproteobacteria bacterium]MBK7068394.1 hypothetical protein [Deltaproteobacteria bacterium]MBK8691925.1 hypothetical protein [Deltaproteobacteria bacterium]
MKTPPSAILKAALDVMFVCGVYTRNWTLRDDFSRKQINDLWEAVHEIPSLLTRWHDGAEQELLRYLEEYDGKWPVPRLKERYLLTRDQTET